jgi:energy-converting hydrogenase Eha subunit C
MKIKNLFYGFAVSMSFVLGFVQVGHAAINTIDIANNRSAWINSLKPTAKIGAELTITENNKANYSILLSKKPTTQDQKAAEDLKTWLEKMTGATIQIVTESKNSKTSDQVISIGQTQLFKKSKLAASAENLKDEGYGIDQKDNTLFIWGGRTRGVINGVYALLEEDLGCRWYSNECNMIPSIGTLKFAPALRTFVPALSCRDPFWYVAFDATWSLHNRTNAPSAKVPEEWGGTIDYGGMFVHTFHNLFPEDEYLAAHPEYYMLNDQNKRVTNQLCTTNPEVIRLVKEKVRKVLKANPYAELISISKNDGGGTCACINCKSLDVAEGSKMASLMVLVNAVAKDIEKDYPHVLISTLAYGETGPIPKTMRPNKNVSIMLCSDKTGAWRRPFEPTEICEIGTLVKNWSKVCKRLFIWDYNINFSHYLAPMPNLDVMAENIRFYVANNAEGVMLQANYQTVGSERDWMRSWVAAKLLWNPSLNLYDLIDDFIYGYFGKAAPAVAQYNRLLQKQEEIYKTELSGKWLMDHKYKPIRYDMDHPFLSKEFLYYSTQLYDQAEKLAENQQVLDRVQRDRLPITYVKLVRGPEFVGPDYLMELDRFEKTTNKIGITHLREGGSKKDIENKITLWRKSWNEYTTKK